MPVDALQTLLEECSEFKVPGPDTVWALGEVDLGDSVRLLRFYLDSDDYWLQVLMHGSAPGDTVLFGYDSAVSVLDEAHLQQLSIGVGMPIFEYRGSLYSRQWGHEEGQTGLVALCEQIGNPQTHYTVHYLSMLYARDTGLPDRREFLLLSVEQDEQGTLTFTTSLGVTLRPTDFHVT
jgi:hypothetical protein